MTKLGVIGCGGMGSHHAKTVHDMDDVQLVGVADTIESKAVALANELGVAAYTDFHDLLPLADGVMVCTPPFAHTLMWCLTAPVTVNTSSLKSPSP